MSLEWIEYVGLTFNFLEVAWKLVRGVIKFVHKIIKTIWNKTEQDVRNKYDEVKDEGENFKIAFILRINGQNIAKRRKEVEASLISVELDKLDSLIP
ncbi:unnamed protein product [Adineta ricciae]|uniref:Uncharacterized protein n=1 Tax=Adineta ricciae TaxID=249248 RepID=A0A815L328_ADIRI|nr:unnamed protein product [Adineta ricciae]CAF1675155.1 unnamed protein product [Adineta ricciae]